MKRLIMVGFAIWLVATIALRMAGQRVLNPDRPWSIIALLAISALLMFRLPRFLFSRLAIPWEQRALGGIALVAPGMFLDTVSAVCFSSVFPNIQPDAAGLFGGWLLFCNVVVLVSAATTSYGTAGEAAATDQ
ncbi:MAG TPA: DUF5367 family protein [Thermoanaerobaculia bacterium]|jgi:hypothetical protein|nr:DUF5367 family protein [Thermoanaerobaculia bacterium]